MAKESRVRATSLSIDEEFPSRGAVWTYFSVEACRTFYSDIAEGSKRQTNAEYARFLNIAEGSLAESEYLLMVGRDLGYLSEMVCKPVLSDVSELAKMLHGLRAKVGKSC